MVSSLGASPERSMPAVCIVCRKRHTKGVAAHLADKGGLAAQAGMHGQYVAGAPPGLHAQKRHAQKSLSPQG